MSTYVLADKRYDVFFSFHGGEVLYKEGERKFILRDIVEKLEGGVLQERWVTRHTGKLSIFYDNAEIKENPEGTLNNILEGLLQTRGGGVVAILVSKDYFEREWCLTELLCAMKLFSRNDAGIRICFIGVDITVKNIKESWFMRENGQPLLGPNEIHYHSLPLKKAKSTTEIQNALSEAARRIADMIVSRASGEAGFDPILAGKTQEQTFNLLAEEIVDRLKGRDEFDPLVAKFPASGQSPLLALIRYNRQEVLPKLRDFLEERHPSDAVKACKQRIMAYERKWTQTWSSNDWDATREELLEQRTDAIKLLMQKSRHSLHAESQELNHEDVGEGSSSVMIVTTEAQERVCEELAAKLNSYEETKAQVWMAFEARRKLESVSFGRMSRRSFIFMVTSEFVLDRDARLFIRKLVDSGLSRQSINVFPVFWSVTPEQCAKFLEPIPTLAKHYVGYKRPGFSPRHEADVEACAREFRSVMRRFRSPSSPDAPPSPTSKTRYHVYISYAKGHREYALRLYEALTNRLKLSVFLFRKLYTEDRLPGRIVRNAIKNSLFFVPLLSEEYSVDEAWPSTELDWSYERQIQVDHDFWLPVYFGITREECALREVTQKIAAVRGINCDLEAPIEERAQLMTERAVYRIASKVDEFFRFQDRNRNEFPQPSSWMPKLSL